ncbi:PIN domain-containing protein [Terrilactibacillus laevilacticus]|uniref:PIN domain-containing protein n=1 Tax=Terrilactibacillus laevilacticus TaxID=1380157 RepID=A0ABW5PVH6_9BACI|nr:PIN domain-containing protein [Terrilactibacillus laevilacticus]
MSSIFNNDHPPKVFLDTTVICGAIRKNGVNRKILQVARLPYLYQPVLSRVCLFEFIRNATNGIGKGEKMVKYEEWEIQTFLNDFVYPILEHYSDLPVNSVVGRYSIETRIRDNRPIGEVLIELTGLTNKDAEKLAIEHSKEMQEPLKKFDQRRFSCMGYCHPTRM